MHIGDDASFPNPIFVTQDNDPDNYNGFWFLISPTAVVFEFGDGTGSNNPAFRRGKIASISNVTNRWIHVCGVMKSASDIDIYINGINVGGNSSGLSNLPMSSNFPSDVAKIGYQISNATVYRFKGLMDDVRLYNRALTATEVRTFMCKKLVGNEAGLIGYWNFDEVNGNTVLDKSSNGFNGQVIGNPGREYSGAPIGDESVYLYQGTWTGSEISMNEGLHTARASNIQGNPQGIHLYTIRNGPSQTQGLTAASTPPYFGAFIAALDINNTFQFSLDGKMCGLFVRKDNSESLWLTAQQNLISTDRNEFIGGAAIGELNIDLGPDETLCPFVPKTLIPLANPSGYAFVWQDGSTQSTFQATGYGDYWVTVSNGCHMDRDTISFVKQEIPLSIDLGPDEIVCPLEPRILTPLNNPTGFEFTWHDGSKQSSFQISGYGKYWVTVKNSCSMASDTITISQREVSDIFIPNVITPNHDSKNQHFEIDKQLAGSSLQIFNRWGRKVYEADNYHNNWDGNDLPAGIYFYYIKNPCTTDIKGYLSVIK